MHYCSALIHALGTLGMKTSYTREATGLKNFVNLLFALAFAPPDAIVLLYRYILDNEVGQVLGAIPQLGDFLRYYEDEWLSNPDKIRTWCVYDRGDLAKRTNNNLEGQHAQYLQWFGKHTNIWTFLRKLILSQKRKQFEEDQFLVGGHVQSRQRTRNYRKEQRLVTLRNIFQTSERYLSNVHTYIVSVSFLMRRYEFPNVSTDEEVNSDEDMGEEDEDGEADEL